MATYDGNALYRTGRWVGTPEDVQPLLVVPVRGRVQLAEALLHEAQQLLQQLRIGGLRQARPADGESFGVARADARRRQMVRIRPNGEQHLARPAVGRHCRREQQIRGPFTLHPAGSCAEAAEDRIGQIGRRRKRRRAR